MRLTRRSTLWALALVGLGACGGDDEGPTFRDDGGLARDASTDGGGAADRCDLRCEPDETLVDADSADCRCTGAGVRMRLGELDDDFYAQPWPLATRLERDGTLNLQGLPTAAGAAFINDNLDRLARGTQGFGTTAAMFASFDGELDPDSLPKDAAASLEDESSIFLVDIDPESDDYGARTPILCSYRDDASDYNPRHFLSCLPLPGFPLAPHTLYGLYFTTELRDADGGAVRVSQRFVDVMDAFEGDDGDTALIDAFEPFVDFVLAEGMRLDTIVGGTVFRTSDPVAPMRAIAEHIASLPAPELTALESYPGPLPSDESGNFVAVQGTYRAPIYQQGTTPYERTGGDIRFDAGGAPVVATEMQLRFGLTLPATPMPSGGWPVVLYHHGTGGDAFSFIRDGTAYHLAAAGVAAIGIDAPVHGLRRPAGADPTFLFFNTGNVLALRDNIRQGAADLLVLQRFVQGLEVIAAASPTGEAIRFDTDKVFVMGHSQGGLTAPIMLAVADGVRGAMLSGAGGSITMTILFKTEPIDIPALARTILALPQGETLDAFHPVLAIVQSFTEIADPINFVPYFYRWPGGNAFDLWLTQGLLDLQVPPAVTGALATAAGVSPVNPISLEIDGLTMRGLEPLDAPVSGNTTGLDGKTYTAVYTQYPNDGHFAVFDNPATEAQLEHWFATLASGGPAELSRE